MDFISPPRKWVTTATYGGGGGGDGGDGGLCARFDYRLNQRSALYGFPERQAPRVRRRCSRHCVNRDLAFMRGAYTYDVRSTVPLVEQRGRDFKSLGSAYRARARAGPRRERARPMRDRAEIRVAATVAATAIATGKMR